MILAAVIVWSFRKCTFSNVKWFGLFICIIFLLEYGSALANFSQLNSPSVFPVPFRDGDVAPPIGVPIFEKFGKPITNTTKDPDTKEETIIPTKMAFYLGFVISSGRIYSMWLDWFVIVLVNYYIIYFYSTAYELNMGLNMKETIQKNLQEIENEVEESVILSKNASVRGSRAGSINATLRKNSSIHGRSNLIDDIENETNLKKTSTNFDEAHNYIKEVEKSMLICKFYNGLSLFVSATSTIISLVCLLMISFQIRGLINLIYIAFCLFFLVKSINFIYQVGWNFEWYLKRVLKIIIISEITLQFLYQIPIDALHEGEDDERRWQRIIGVRTVWTLNDETPPLPKHINVGFLLLKCIMYAFVLFQQNIFRSKEYKYFKSNTLSKIRSLSEKKAEAMAYLYNNFKIRTTIKNQFEKETMMKKLAKVNKQVKKWNQLLGKGGAVTDENMKKIKDAVNNPQAKKEIKEVDEKFEEDKEWEKEETKKEEAPKMIITTSKPKVQNPEEEKLTPEEIEEAKEREQEYDELPVNDKVNKLVSDNLGFLWRVWIFLTRNATNQILLIFDLEILETIKDQVHDGETKIHTHIEKAVLKDYDHDSKIRNEKGLETVLQIPKEERSKESEKESKGGKVILAYLSLLFQLLLSNSALICYLLMIVWMIMNGSILSLVYPISIFIYALLEERRPSRRYWMVILYFTAIVLVLKFLFQTFPLSDWLTEQFDETDPNQTEANKSANDYFRTIRLGLEVLQDDGRSFVQYFLFEALILLSVTLHIFIQVFGGVWQSREVETETIKDAAARIANSQKARRQQKELKELKDVSCLGSFDNDLLRNLNNDVLPYGYEKLRRRRAYSVNDCTRFSEIIQDMKANDSSPSEVSESDYED